MDMVKMAGVCNWPVSHNSTDLQTFLDFTNFYSRFICGFLDIAHSLFNLTGSNNIRTWTATQKDVFDTLKTAIASALILVFFDTSTSFQIKVDSLNFATGAVLPHEFNADGK